MNTMLSSWMRLTTAVLAFLALQSAGRTQTTQGTTISAGQWIVWSGASSFTATAPSKASSSASSGASSSDLGTEFSPASASSTPLSSPLLGEGTPSPLDALRVPAAPNLEETYRSRDQQLNEVYRTLYGRLGPADRERLKVSEREWIKNLEQVKDAQQKIEQIEARTTSLQQALDQITGPQTYHFRQ